MSNKEEVSGELDTSNVRSKEDLSAFLQKVDKEQNSGPFNLRDSGVLKDLHKKLEENAVNYDDEPVVACPHCNSLYLKDTDEALECFSCGNEVQEKDVVVYRSIIHYLEEKETKENEGS